MNDTSVIRFAELDLPEPLLRAVTEAGYDTPSPIQAECIPLLLSGRDVLGQAQTGTGKTAAFGLPLLARIDVHRCEPQLLVLAPTRELASQVAGALRGYARHLPGLEVLPIYGGQAYGDQLRGLRRGAQVVVGTPGRVMDHMRKGSLKVDTLRALVLDEADEMLRMGFIDDVEWVLEHIPQERQIALFSATMPDAIRRVAERYLRDPEQVRIRSKTTTATTVRQRCWVASGMHKLDALSRLLEVEPRDGVIVFVRTRSATTDLAEKLRSRGVAAEALNGDIPQAQREKTVARLKDGLVDVLVATDVAARGLDVPRISHVINYDIPHDTEAYVHRIGRTGRAGRTGEAILFISPRERRLLKAIERATGQSIETMRIPDVAEVNRVRLQRFQQRVLDTMQDAQALAPYREVLDELVRTDGNDPLQLAAALAALLHEGKPLLLPESRTGAPRAGNGLEHCTERPRRACKKVTPSARARPLEAHPEVEMERFRIEVGHAHGVRPGNIVGAIANEAEIESRYIGHIAIFDDFSTIDLPAGMPPETFRDLQKIWVCQRQLRIRRLRSGSGDKASRGENRKAVAKRPARAGASGSGGRAARARLSLRSE